MSYRPLILSAKTSNWRMHDDNHASSDAEFQIARKKVLDRDNHVCQFCGFKASKWQEVHHVNNDHADNRQDNLVTICFFCHMVHHIGLAGLNREAILVWLPEIAQSHISHIVRNLLVIRSYSDEILSKPNTNPTDKMRSEKIRAAAGAIMGEMMSRKREAYEVIGTYDPLDLADVFLNMPDEIYGDRRKITTGIRLLPLGMKSNGPIPDIIPQIVKDWRGPGGPYSNLSPSIWANILNNFLEPS